MKRLMLRSDVLIGAGEVDVCISEFCRLRPPSDTNILPKAV